MNTTPDTPSDDDDMPAEVDFSKGVRGKFYKPGLRLIAPVRLEQQMQDTPEQPTLEEN